MNYKKYKHMEISQVGMGCYALSGAYGDTDPRAYKKVLEYAFELGVNYFDTAQSYGKIAERTLGEVIKPFREEVCISTKIGMKDGIIPSLSYDHVVKACHRSLETLGTDYIDFYLVHYADPNTPVQETVNALEDLKGDGKIIEYGLSHLSVEDVQDYIRKGDPGMAMMELSAVARTSRNELLPIYVKNNIGSAAFSVTGRGVLSGNYGKECVFQKGDIRSMDPLFHPSQLESALRVVERLKELGRKYDKTPVQTAMGWVLSQPGIVTALTGPSRKEHLEENVGASGWSINKEDLVALDEFFKDEDEYLAREEPLVIKEILTKPLPEDTSAALSDLVYSLECAVTNDIATEKEVLPIFYSLLELRNSGKLTSDKLTEIQSSIRQILYGRNKKV